MGQIPLSTERISSLLLLLILLLRILYEIVIAIIFFISLAMSLHACRTAHVIILSHRCIQNLH